MNELKLGDTVKFIGMVGATDRAPLFRVDEIRNWSVKLTPRGLGGVIWANPDYLMLAEPQGEPNQYKDGDIVK